MKTKSFFFLPALIAALNLIPAGRVTAQTFTTLKSFGMLTNVTGYNPQSALVQAPDGTLYGTAKNGDGTVAGTIFKVQPDGSGFGVLKWFTNSLEGANPYPGLALSGSVLYGTTAYGGTSNYGTVFKIATDGTGHTVLKHFTGSDGANPYYAGLVLSGSVLYGTTYSGGTSNYGVLFKLNTDGTGYSVLKYFAGSNGANPNAALTFSEGVLYGSTEYGGSSSAGTVFKVNTDGTGYTLLHNFTRAPDGAFPDGVLTLSGGVLYGTTYNGGTYNGNVGGTVFKVNTNGTGYAVLKSFDFGEINPSGLLPLSDGVLYGTASGGGFLNGAVFKINTNGTGYTVLKTLTNSPDGGTPYAGVMLSGSALYGTAAIGGISGWGTVFKVNTDGSGFSVLKNFNKNTLDAAKPYGLALSGNVLYSATLGGGSSNYGTLFKMNTDGSGYSVLKEFAFSDGKSPGAGPTLSGGVLYGATENGGNSNSGTLFQVNTDGTGFSVLRHFSSATTDPATGYSTNSDGRTSIASLTLSGGTLYGTMVRGGNSGHGVVFQANTDGSGYTVLKQFSATANNSAGAYTNGDGAAPNAALTLSGSVLYGTTAEGGNGGNGTVFRVNTDGSSYTVLKQFSAGHNNATGIYTNSGGASPRANLTLSGGTLFGATYRGGSSGNGTVFKLNTDGTGYTVLKDFSATTLNPSTGARTNSDGATLQAGLTLVGDVLFGATSLGGSSGKGTVFQLNTNGTGFNVLKNFAGSPDGARPLVGLTLGGSALYGTADEGGDFGLGTVFSLSFPPQLTITPSGPFVILSWPANVAGFDYTGYTLQSATSLGSPVWTTVFSPPVVIGGRNTVTEPNTGAQQFYRLVQ